MLRKMTGEPITQGWLNIAELNPGLRYPKFRMRVGNFNNRKHNILFETFVHNKNKDRLLFHAKNYLIDDYFENLNELEKVKNNFLYNCKLSIDHFIFNKENSIYEPYETNKLR